MAKVIQGKRLAEDEEPERHVAAEGKRILKDMVVHQLDTSLTVDGQQKRERTFVPGAPLDGGSAPSGAISSASYSALRENDEVRLKLLGAGVDPEDIEKLFTNEKRRLSEPESLARQQLWNEAAQKLLDADSRVDQLPSQRTRLEKELCECVPVTGLDAHLVQTQRRSSPATTSKRADDFLAAELQKTEKELFGHLDSVKAPSATSRKRRKDRKVVDSLAPSTHNTEAPQTSKLFGSLWDMKTVPQTHVSSIQFPNPVASPTPSSKPSLKKKKKLGCSQHRLFTIKNGTIVELKGKHIEESGHSGSSTAVTPSINRMTIEDIRAIPKFSKYQPGMPNKVLFVKNFPHRLTDGDLLSIFSKFGPVECRVMTGKMKGQAFITFFDEQTAQRALDGIIGTCINNKPLIIQFGRSQPSDKSGT